MVNITVLAANRPSLLKQTLNSIGDLSDATVTIRDAGMNPEVATILRDWRRDKYASVLTCPTPCGTGPARNSVVHSSAFCFGRGDYLYLSDDDVCFLRPDWLKVLIEAYERAWDHGYRVIGAYNHPYHQPVSSIGDVYEVYALALQSMLMRWEVWDKYGPFRETTVGAVCQGEDVDFGNAVRADGYKLGVISPALLVNCGITNSFGQPIPGAEMVRAQAPKGVICE
jgi:Glycosyl transferase family 2